MPNTRPFGQPFVLPLGSKLLPPSQWDFYEGERVVVNVAEPATMAFSDSAAKGPTLHTKTSETGEFNWSREEILAVIPEGATKQWYVWTGPVDDMRVRALGTLSCLPAAVPGTTNVLNVVYDGNNVVSGPYNVIYKEVA